MSSPFPGVDPFLESQHYWPDFHATFVPCWRETISRALPAHYEARIEEQVEIFELEPEDSRLIRPDVAIVRDPGRLPSGAEPRESNGAVATLEAVSMPLPVSEEVRDRWIQIFHRPSRSLVAVLELLSPTNRTNPGRGQYLGKRARLLIENVHLVEVDLLVKGERLPMARTLPPGDFYVIVARADSRPKGDVYAWTVRDSLPIIPIPLLKPDKDIALDLGQVFRLAYERGTYEKSIDYSAPLQLPLNEQSRDGAERTGKSVTPES